MYKLGLEKAEKPEVKLPTFFGSWRKQGSSRKKNIYFCLFDYTKGFDYMDHSRLWKILEEMGVTKPPYLPPKKSVCRSKRNS